MSRRLLNNLPLHLEIVDMLIKDVGGKWEFTDKLNCLGATCILTHHIALSTSLLVDSEDMFYTAVFHEMQHIICVKKGLVPELHKNHPLMLSERARMIGELEVEVLADAHMRIYFPELVYQYPYIEHAQYVEKEIERFNRERLKRGLP